jgi:hypothetical protein
MKPDVDAVLTGRRMNFLADLAEQEERSQHYLFCRDQAGAAYVYDVDRDLPCQFLRRAASRAWDIGDESGWVVFPRLDVFTRTLAEVRW